MNALLPDRQVGDTSPFAFQVIDGTTGEVSDLSDGDDVWMDMIDSASTAKIDKASMVKDRSTSVVTYAPSTTEVDTAGVYTVQVYRLRENGERDVSVRARIRLVANSRTLTF